MLKNSPDKRISEILSDSEIEEDDLWVSSKKSQKYLQYLRVNISFPCILTGIECFTWEEIYLFGFGDQNEYEKLKKSYPSYKDKLELVKFEKIVKDKIQAKVKRQNDNCEFIIPLGLLEVTDKNSKNHQLIEDYAIWVENYGD